MSYLTYALVQPVPINYRKRHPELCSSWTGSVLTTCYLATTSNTRWQLIMSLPLSNTNRRPGVSLSVIMVGWESPVLGNIKTYKNLAKNFNFLFNCINRHMPE